MYLASIFSFYRWLIPAAEVDDVENFIAVALSLYLLVSGLSVQSRVSGASPCLDTTFSGFSSTYSSNSRGRKGAERTYIHLLGLILMIII